MLGRRQLAKRHRAVTEICRVFRGHTTRLQLLHRQQQAIRIQAYIRMVWKRRRYLNLRWAAIVLQEFWRAVRTDRNWHQIVRENQASCIIQKYVRRYLVHIRVTRYLRNVLLIQTVARRFLVIRPLRRQWFAAECLQRAWRCYRARRRMAILRRAVETARRYSLGYRARSHPQCVLPLSTRSNYGKMIRLQAWWRGLLVRRRLAFLSRAATVIQTAWKRVRDSRRYTKARWAAITIRRIWLGHRDRRQLRRQIEAVRVIQHHWTGYLRHKKRMRVHQSILDLQRHWRGSRSRHYARQYHAHFAGLVLAKPDADNEWLTRKEMELDLRAQHIQEERARLDEPVVSKWPYRDGAVSIGPPKTLRQDLIDTRNWLLNHVPADIILRQVLSVSGYSLVASVERVGAGRNMTWKFSFFDPVVQRVYRVSLAIASFGVIFQTLRFRLHKLGWKARDIKRDLLRKDRVMWAQTLLRLFTARLVARSQDEKDEKEIKEEKQEGKQEEKEVVGWSNTGPVPARFAPDRKLVLQLDVVIPNSPVIQAVLE
eukprot:TRINITY_DN8066_c0_g1_i2.p1 TRINITY_DN8066_c0_g1~~TRINITY_DN8066_c0_g1_i2.p1  ORF type:complete len:540 (-),score=116.49 TRINITY_DN8066_c0_g1_i2:107-1726(-)